MEEIGPAKPVMNEEQATPVAPMPAIPPIPVANVDNVNVNTIETKEYKLNLDKDIYSLKIETFTNGNINFTVRHKNTIPTSYFTKTYVFEDILQKLYLFKEHHDNITKILKYIDTSISQQKMNLIKENNKLKLSLKKIIDYDEINCILDLDEIKVNNDDLLKIMIDEIKELQSKENEKEKEKKNYQNVLNMIKELKDEIEKLF